MRSRSVALFVTAAMSVTMTAGIDFLAQTSAQATSQASVVSEYPGQQTPNVLDGKINAIAKVGNTIVIGGQFSKIQAARGGPVLVRKNLAAFNATTGAISSTFRPNPSGVVTAVINGPDGHSIYVGGQFDTIGGVNSPSLAKLYVGNGKPVAGFRRPSLRGRVSDLRSFKGRLWVAGDFTAVAGHAQPILATLNPYTGAYSSYMHLRFAAPRSTPTLRGKLRVIKMDVAPNGRQLVVIGNFTKVAASARTQVVKLDVSGSAARVAPWRTTFYSSICSSAKDTYMRDVDFSPDGRYFVIGTTGGYGGPNAGCDNVARFETGGIGSGIRPTWTDYTGGDTTFTVEVTGTAVYTGGHFRWQNNPYAGDRPSNGAVAREGLAALDPQNGLPLKWNPGRAKGVGVFDMLATSTGLWVGSDTDRIGHWQHHAKIAYFPLAGGEHLAARTSAVLPGKLYRGGPVSGANSLVARRFTGSAVGTPLVRPAGIAWNNVRGAFMIGNTLYTGGTDGRLFKRSFTGSSYGPASVVNGADLIVKLSFDTRTLTGMYYSGGYIYYTTSGSKALYARAFTPSSGVVGAIRHTVSGNLPGIDFSHVHGMFTAGGRLYWAQSTDGSLRSATLVGSKPKANTTKVITTPKVNKVDWRGRALFVGVGSAR